MPILSKFYGITILMHFQESEHNPPHFHAVYNDYDAIISISDGKYSMVICLIKLIIW